MAAMESDDDEDGGADFGAIGFMFDAETSRSERRFSFPIGGGQHQHQHQHQHQQWVRRLRCWRCG